MPKHPSKQKRARRAALASLILPLLVLFVACAGQLAVSLAQTTQTPQGEPRQRPRRVGSTLPSPTPAQVTPRPTPTSAPPPTAAEEVGEDDVVRVETQLVTVPVTVTDRTGRTLTNLRAENFALYEDGRPQRVANFIATDAPFEVALLLDTSGSTRAEVGLIRRAANVFIDALRPGDRIAILAFNSQEDAGTKLATVELMTHLTDNRDVLQQAIENIGTSNGTPFYDALERVAKEVFREPPRPELRGRRALVALTDGVDSTSEADFAEARARLQQTGTLAYFIQVNTEEFVEERLMKDCQDDGRLSLSRVQLQRYRKIFDPRAEAADYSNFCRMGPFERMQISRSLYQLARREMQELARDSGGKTFNAADLRDARAAFAQVAADIGKQYSLGYYSTNKARDGGFRQIRVEVRGLQQGAQVVAREGYQAPKS
ncbi:MAG: Ca-activated chloride channel [Pyrinomonadaceae bacterium]|jgi:VWFA-related protein|nr:Ca-activated chloride channel [Pyrinomonadaceae bacterium]